MSRDRSRNDRGGAFSPLQRKACIVLACCALALILTIVGAVLLVGGLGTQKKSGYDPAAYPVDTSLGAVLPSGSESDASYLTQTVFVGDDNIVNLCDLGLITLDQYVGADGLSVRDVISKTCVYFADNANSFTIPQAVAMMKPRRVIVVLGANDADAATTADAFIQDYRQALNAITQAYSYCDIIVASVPPVSETDDNADETQTLIDQYNQQLALMCESAGYKFLNSAELLKENSGFGEDSYLDSGAWNRTGGNTFLQYVRSHPYTAEDRRPDTSDVPRRAAQPSGSGTETTEATPSPTPVKVTASYRVEEGKGTLTGNGQSGVTSLDVETDPRSTVSVTAVAADGYTFYRWSDGKTDATRYDVVVEDISVTAMFNDARVSISLDRSAAEMNLGDTVTITASVTLGDKTYDNSGVQWAVNGDMQATAGSFTFAPTAAGDYTVRAGIEINGTFASAEVEYTVKGPTTTVSIAGNASIPAGSTTTLTATVTNGSGDTTWACPQQPGWTATGDQVQFSAATVGSYTVQATNNGVTSEFAITVTEAAATPAPVPTAGPTAEPVAPVEPTPTPTADFVPVE